MELEQLLDRCHGLERRAAALYRSFGAATRDDPKLCALWTELARQEEEHAASIERARTHLRVQGMSRTALDGWEETLAEVEERLAVGERLGGSATPARQFAAALDIEMTELDALRGVALAAAHEPAPTEQEDHAERLARVAESLSQDPQVRLQAALLRARARLGRA
jgi:rubrerythrin